MASYITKNSPGSLLVLYVIDKGKSELRVAHAWGENAALIDDLRIPLGKGLSGSVATGSKAVRDVDASLDFEDCPRYIPRLKSGSATPISVDNHVVGVLAMYLLDKSQTLKIPNRNLELAGAQLSTYLSSLAFPFWIHSIISTVVNDAWQS